MPLYLRCLNGSERLYYTRLGSECTIASPWAIVTVQPIVTAVPVNAGWCDGNYYITCEMLDAIHSVA